MKAGSLRYKALLDEALQLHLKKNAGYSADNPDAFANFREVTKAGMTPLQGIITRMSDKYARAMSLFKNPENDQVGESMRDTLMDLSAYALIYICLAEEEMQVEAEDHSEAYLEPNLEGPACCIAGIEAEVCCDALQCKEDCSCSKGDSFDAFMGEARKDLSETAPGIFPLRERDVPEKDVEVYVSILAPYDNRAVTRSWRLDGEKTGGVVVSFCLEGIDQDFGNEERLHPIDVSLTDAALNRLGYVNVGGVQGDAWYEKQAEQEFEDLSVYTSDTPAEADPAVFDSSQGTPPLDSEQEMC
jgi:hypothetical protein